MLDTLNRYIHGYFAAPILLACYQKDVFNLLLHNNFSVELLSKQFKINEGHAQLILHLIEGCTPDSFLDESPGNIMALYQSSPSSLFKKPFYSLLLQQCLQSILTNKKNTPSLWHDSIEGAVLLPLLIAFKRSLNKKILSGLSEECREPIINLLIRLQWAKEKKDQLILTEAGQSLLECAYHMRSVVSYAPLLCDTYSYLTHADQDDKQHAVDKVLRVIQYSLAYAKQYIYKKHAYALHYAKKDDVSQLLPLEKKCWPSHLVVSSRELARRIAQFPQGQLVLKTNHHLVASVYSQKLAHLDELLVSSFSDIPKLHDASGTLIRLLGISVHPDFQNQGLGDQLMAFILWWAALSGDIEKVVGVTRCQDYSKHSPLSMQDYVSKHQETPIGVDPILRFHTSRGAKIKGVISHYRPEDEDNQGAGILVEYTLNEPAVQQRPTFKANGPILDRVKKCLQESQSKISLGEFSLTAPLMEMGLDSLRLLELRTKLNQEFGVELDATFFFEHCTISDIVDYLQKCCPAAQPSLSAEKPQEINEPIAIIGMACRFPNGIKNPDDFWACLEEGKNVITEMPSERINKIGKLFSHGGFLKDADCFDANFFRISPREAEGMDPQQRILLEVSWEALEHAGLSANQLSGSNSGIFVGIFSHDYETLLTKNNISKDMGGYFATGNAESVVAGRLSYLLGWQGPAMAINTACSSSLVAVHLACQSIRQGECDLALAAGVNLIFSSELNTAFSQAGMLSPNGQCKTFDAAANGYVRSEGCAALIFKKLSHALADQDSILGVIRSSVVNQDGASNGLTAPSKTSQVALLRKALQKAEIASKQVAYIETHGTGTALGDPIEVKAIKESYGEGRTKENPLILGAVKTNIGHTEAVAGLAGLIKTLLIFKHQNIPANLHFSNLNPHIEKAEYLIIPSQLTPWPKVSSLPCLAGVSSFGFSGTNAHVIVESAPVSSLVRQRHHSSYLFTLSAKTDEALQQRIIDLENWLSLNCSDYAGQESCLLGDISYTLNKGRVHFEKRFACIASSLLELQEKLKQNEATQPTLLTQTYSSNHTLLSPLLVQNYIQGLEIDFDALHAGEDKRRIALPSYPFARERYWLPEKHLDPVSTRDFSPLHPLLDKNISVLNDFCFAKQFQARAFYLNDHRIDHIATLPAVVYLEMARAAASFISPQTRVSGFANVVWMQPITLQDHATCNATIHLSPIENGLEFTLFTGTEEKRLHAKGQLRCTKKTEPLLSESLDIASIQKRCPIKQTKESVYNTFQARGLFYGPAFQIIEAISKGKQEALAILHLSEQVKTEFTENDLHLSLMDGGLQALLITLFDDKADSLMLPFSVDQIDILQPSAIASIAYAYVQLHTSSVMLLDQHGSAIVKFQAISMRSASALSTEFKNGYYCPRWIRSPLPLTQENFSDSSRKNPKQILVVYPPECELLSQALVTTYAQDEIKTIVLEKGQPCTQTFFSDQINLKVGNTLNELYFFGGMLNLSDEEELYTTENAQEQGVLALFHLLKGLIQVGLWSQVSTCKILIWDTHPVSNDDVIKPHFAGLIGFVHVLSQEYPQIKISIIDLASREGLSRPELLASAICAEPAHKNADYVALREGNRYERVIEPLTFALGNPAFTLFRKQGVYLLVGGGGGIGFVLSTYLAKHYQARLVWVSRRAQTVYQKQIDAIHAEGGEILYCQADVSDKTAMQAVVQQVKTRFGVIHGAVHSALALKDKLVANMDEESLRLALACKVEGSIILHAVLKHEPLDFMLFFSSFLSFTSNPGQSNYLAGCTFQDALAQSLMTSSGFPVKLINWGYWGSVGIVATDQHRARMQKQGIGSIEPDEGIAAIHHLLQHSCHQLLVIKAKDTLLTKMGLGQTSETLTALPALPTCLKAVMQDLSSQIIPPDFSGETLTTLHSLASLFLLQALQRLGLFHSQQKTYHQNNLQKQLGILPKYTRLFQALLALLEKNGYVTLENENLSLSSYAYSMQDSLNNELLEQKRLALLSAHPDLAAHITLLCTCLSAYPALLTGKISPMEVMFPHASLSLVEKIYCGHAAADYCNQRLAHCIRTYVQERLRLDANAKITILEIGAGTGGSSASLLQALEPMHNNIHYLYTDVSVAFLHHGEERWRKKYPWISFKKLNIEESPAEQDQEFALGSVDVVVASNVLHATKQINLTLSHVKQLLKAQGLLFLNEIVQCSDFWTLTFGLMDGWWLFEDADYRLSHSPLLSEAQWRQRFVENGLVMADHPCLSAHGSLHDQALLIAQSDGLVRMKQETTPRFLEPSLTQASFVENNSNEGLKKSLEDYLKNVFSHTLKLNKAMIKNQQTFDHYGVDSLISLEINRELGLTFENLPATLLFEYMTLDKLTAYFMQHHHSLLEKKFSKPLLAPMQSGAPVSAVMPAVVLKHPVAHAQDIAIIACVGRYPEANNINEFWELLSQGKSAIRSIPHSRWNWQDYFHATPGMPGKSYSHCGGFIQGVDQFDPLFFNISPAEAEQMDPQERLFLEMAWTALEEANYTKKELEDLQHQVGVFVGVMNHDYSFYQEESRLKKHYQTARSDYWSIANRVSYFFDLQGPSLAVDTACSSSLSAIHLAYQSLCHGECKLAIAGGINLILHPNHYLTLSQLRMLSHGEACRAFGNQADGFVPGEGIGVILLKPLEQALADHDLIYGIIKGAAMNAGGKTSGYMVPNPNAQAQVITQALQKANTPPASISYIEAHGTGTALGDPIEIAGLTKAFSGDLNREKCAIGSVKTNIGHLESAAGMAALTKVILQMKHQRLVPSLHAEVLNTHIDFPNTPFYVQQNDTEWKAPSSYPRRAGISSFGAGGSNAHIILEEAPVSSLSQVVESGKPFYLLLLSAKTSSALQQRMNDLRTWLNQPFQPSFTLENISYTLNVKRTHFDRRCAMVVASLPELKDTLDQVLVGEPPTHYLVNTQNEAMQQDDLFDEMLANVLDAISNISILDVMTYRKKLLALAQLYIKGYDIDGERLHNNETKIKLLLPTYPFARERYWLPSLPVSAKLTIPSTFAHTDAPLTNLLEKITAKLLQLVSDLLKIKINDLDPKQELSRYGIDSVGITQLTNAINAHYQLSLTPALWFEHPNLASFADYIATQHNPTWAVESPSPASDSVNVMRESVAYSSEGIAIIGISGRFPGAQDIAQFWENLDQGLDAICEIPKDRWDWEKIAAGNAQLKWGGLIEGIDQFDAEFFNISPREAELMDPQQRLFLQAACHAIEDAGYDKATLSQLKTGVFVGAVNHDYAEIVQKNNTTDAYNTTGLIPSFIANRVSYFLNLHGPSETIDTACSSSLVAIHHAVQAIQYGDCEAAIVGGVNAILTPSMSLAASKAGMLSADGRCKTFDKNANGYVRAEGVAAMLLKPLSQAQADGDFIYGVIKGTAMNHGGHVNSLTVPNPSAQTDVILSAWRRAKLSLDRLTYIETHGTGTAIGDPIEINALKKAFEQFAKEQPTHNTHCGLGSVKTHIGHLESASGMAGVIKVLLAMQHGRLPANLHFQELNPYIELKNSPFYIVDQSIPWKRTLTDAGEELPLCAGVSAFGFGGVNAHLVLEQAPPLLSSSLNVIQKNYYLVTLSAKHPANLKQKILDLKNWLTKYISSVDLATLSFTLNTGRTHFNARCAIVVHSSTELLEVLQALTQDQECPQVVVNTLDSPSTRYSPVFTEIYKTAIAVIQNDARDNASLYKEKLLLLADLYTKNYPIDWNIIHHHEKKQRLSGLPLYPFTSKRHWIENTPFLPTPLPLSPEIDLPTFTLNYLQSIFSQKLKLPIPEIITDETYETFGMNSLSILDITGRLEEDLGPLSKTLLYEKTKLTDLADYLQIKCKNPLQKMHHPAAVISEPEIKPPSSPNHSLTIPPDATMPTDDDIAIIGLSGTYPQAKNTAEFWKRLAAGQDCITEVPIERWNYKDYPVTVGGEVKYYPHGGFLEDFDKFDPLFFNIAPNDAALMDPQERLFMQSCWETLEDAGYTRARLKQLVRNQVGVFAGVTYNFYPLFIAEEWHKGNRLPLDIQTFSIANRVSYFLNLNGPSFVLDTACSSSLAAIHLACESISQGECVMAIAGGVNLSLHPCKYHALGSYSFMSDQGRCTSFGANGNGYVPGEGVGSVLLKPLTLALKDNDPIYAVIKSSSMNHGGKTSGYTVPNPNAQTELIQNALKKANIHARRISYIEAHGTGTALGDPIEIRGLQEAFETYTLDKQFCAIGSVKSNIGHLESAAGISQLTKVLLQLRHKKLVPSLHAKALNPYIDFAQTPFYVQQELSDWLTSANEPRVAGISSFGAGGTNVHLIIEEYVSPAEEMNSLAFFPVLFLLSALNTQTLHVYAEKFLSYLQEHGQHFSSEEQRNEWINDVCYTLQIGRESMPVRLALIANSYADLMIKLQSYVESSGENLSAPATVTHEKIMEWLQQGDLSQLAESWRKGATIPWINLYSNKKRSCLSLPTYPFAKRRCWIASSASNPYPLIEKNKDKAKDSELNDWLYIPRWEKKSLDNIVSLREENSHWLIFNENELGFHLHDQLGALSCLSCFSGEQFERLADNTVYINAAHSENYDQLIDCVHKEKGAQLTGIIYLASFGEQTEASKQLLSLFHALLKHTWPHALRFCLITRSSQAVGPDDRIAIWQHHLWSLTRILAAEHSEYHVLLLDLAEKKELGQEAKIIAHEITHFRSEENHLAYREQERYVLRLAPYSNPLSLANEKPWQAPKTVLITGGLGALGSEVAKWLVQQGSTHLLLIGSTVLPERSEWTKISEPAYQEKIATLTALEAHPITIKYVAADITDKSHIQAIVATTIEEWKRPIDGVFHLAGITTDHLPIKEMSATVLEKILSAKVQGALVLHELFNESNLHCFVLFSSISALPYFGINGLSAYAMANEFLNGLALCRRQQGLPAISIDWAAWAEKGMSFKHNHDAFLNALGMSSLAPAEGIAVLHQLMTLAPSVVSVFKIRWEQFLKVNPEARRLTFFDTFADQYPEENKKISSISLTVDEVTALLYRVLTMLLGLQTEEMDAHTPFQQYGMDSIIGINFIAQLNDYFPDTLSPMDLYRYPTVEQLCHFILKTGQPHELKQSDDLQEDEVEKLIEEEWMELQEKYGVNNYE